MGVGNVCHLFYVKVLRVSRAAQPGCSRTEICNRAA
jgi:hypothetical protein